MRPTILLVGAILGLGAFVQAQAPPMTPSPMAPLAPPPNVLGPTTPTQPQSSPKQRTIMVSEVEVRSGGSDKYYPTSKLIRGDKVTVLRSSPEFPGWFEIKPPPGSFSWVRETVVKQPGPVVGYINTTPGPKVDVLVGSMLSREPPTVVRAKVEVGTPVVVLDRPFQSDQGKWLPIEPVVGEVRYIPASAVEGSQEEQIASAVPKALIDRADRAFAVGQLPLAQSLYAEAAQVSNDANERNYCFSRLSQVLQARARQTSAPQATAPTTNPAGGWTAQNASQSQARFNDGSISPGPNPYQTAQLSKASSPTWGTWGYLRRTNYRHNGQPVYLVESSTREPLYYIATSRELSLEPYLGRLLNAYGTSGPATDPGLRREIMTVTHVSVR